MKVSIVSLGCKVNQSEGEDLAAALAAVGDAINDDRGGVEAMTDVIVVNTCTVTNEADRKSRKAIYRAVQRAAEAAGAGDAGQARPLVVVTGCYAQVAGQDIENIEGVDVVVAQADKGRLVEEVANRLRERSLSPNQCESGFEAKTGMHSPPKISKKGIMATKAPTRARAYLKVQDGCDNRCSYCIVPDARGNPVSIAENEILTKAKTLADAGAREIIVTGINVGKYGEGSGSGSISGLIRKVLEVPGVARARLSSVEPEDVTDELIEMLRIAERDPHLSPPPSRGRNELGYLCPHFHIPLQSGCDETLARMRRRYTTAGFAEVVARVRKADAGAAITTDLIVGFPGETDEEFGATMRFLEEIRPARIHVFKYSRRRGTPAADMPDQVPDGVKAERSEAVRDLGERLAVEYRDSQADRSLDVLVEREKDGLLVGMTENYLSVTFSGARTLVGQIAKMSIRETRR